MSWGHTEGSYKLLVDLKRECDEQDDVMLLELLPAHRSERWVATMRRGRIYGVKPDASATFTTWEHSRPLPVMIEYERRADTPALFGEKLKRYVDYYSASLDMEDWHRDVVTLFVFPDEIRASGFARNCEQELANADARRSRMSLFITSAERIAGSGWLHPIWIKGGRLEEGRMRFWK